MPNTKTVRNSSNTTKKTVTKAKKVKTEKKPVVKKTVTDVQPINEPVVNEPVVNEPVIDEPVVNEPVIDELVVNEPVLNNSVDTNTEPLLDTNETVTEATNMDDNYIVEKKGKQKPDKESLMKKWDELFSIYADVLKTRKQPHQTLSIFNYLKSLKNDTARVIRVRKQNNTTMNKNNQSGFLKPINVSDELREFIDIDNDPQLKDSPITRVLVTQKLCQYIKEKNLQKPEDKREILPDAGLKKLFDITPDDTEKLTYYSMQKKVQRHIFKI